MYKKIHKWCPLCTKIFGSDPWPSTFRQIPGDPDPAFSEPTDMASDRPNRTRGQESSASFTRPSDRRGSPKMGKEPQCAFE
ncbi:hypothetical protein TNCV_4600911 [Trichonephila clavipes]|nr:hypothetical protein TNCV_4600911 [Trichonephila clavipes]